MRKVLDAEDVQGERDMSGFEFEIHRSDGDVLARLRTGADGRTPIVEAPVDDYTIVEVAHPTWAAGLTNGGPLVVDLGADETVHEVVYINVVPDVAITTAARDAVDGDRVVELAAGDATIVDTITYTSLVPGTEYLASGELMVRSTSPTGATDPSGTRMITTGIAGSTPFTPGQPDGTVEVAFEVPADSPLLGHDVVVYQRLTVAASGRVVADHTDPDAAEQTIRFADVVPTTPPSTAPPTAPPTTIAATTTTATSAPATTSTTTTEPPPTTTTPPSAAPPPATSPPTTPPPPLPRTGNASVGATAIGGSALLVLGAGLLLATRRRRPPEPRPT